MIKIVIYTFFVISLLWLLKKGKSFVYFIPLFNVLTDMTFSFFEGFSEPTIIRGLTLVLFILYFRSSLFKAWKFKPLYIFLAYILILLITSEEFIYSLRAVSQVVISMLMLVVGYVYITDYLRFGRLMRSLFWVVFAAITATIAGYVFGIGKTLEYTADESYSGNPEFIGLLGSGGLYSAALVLGLMPFLLKYKLHPVKKWIFLLASAALYIFILLNVRRTAIIIPVIGIISYLLFTRSRIYSIKLLMVSSLVIVLSYPLYEKILVSRIEVRESEGRFEKDFYKSEARYMENVELVNQMYYFDEPLPILFGFGNNIFAEHISGGKSVRRMFHTDTAKILYGTGIFGFLLYLAVYIFLFIKVFKIKGSGFYKELRAGAIALLLISVFVSLNGSINLITFRTVNFLLIGSFLGMANGIKNGSILPLQKRI